MDSPSSLWVQILVIVVLTAINAIFAASEIAFVSVNQNKVKQLAEEGNKSAIRTLKLLEDSDDFLATIQVVITLAGFLSSASAATSFADIIVDLFPNVPGIGTISILVVTLILSYLSLVFGELFPKQVALQMPERIAMMTSGIVSACQTLFKPFVWLLSTSTDILQRITPIEFSNEEPKYTRHEMQAILQESRREGSIDLAEYSMLEGVLSLDDKIAEEVMVPRTDTVMIDIQDDYEKNMSILLSSPYSRVPLYDDDKDNVIGVIHMKQLIKSAHEHGFEHVDLREMASEPLFVPSTAYIDDLLIEFRREQNHMAILRDEYGGTVGIVTMEDVLEEIVGEIEDETDVVKSGDIRKVDDYNYYLNGMISIDKFNNYFNQSLNSEDVNTIGGLIIDHIGYVPDDDETITLRAHPFVLKTTHIDNGRIRGIHLVLDEEREIQTDHDFYEEEDSVFESLRREEEQYRNNHDEDN